MRGICVMLAMALCAIPASWALDEAELEALSELLSERELSETRGQDKYIEDELAENQDGGDLDGDLDLEDDVRSVLQQLRALKEEREAEEDEAARREMEERGMDEDMNGVLWDGQGTEEELEELLLEYERRNERGEVKGDEQVQQRRNLLREVLLDAQKTPDERAQSETELNEDTRKAVPAPAIPASARAGISTVTMTASTRLRVALPIIYPCYARNFLRVTVVSGCTVDHGYTVHSSYCAGGCPSRAYIFGHWNPYTVYKYCQCCYPRLIVWKWARLRCTTSAGTVYYKWWFFRAIRSCSCQFC